MTLPDPSNSDQQTPGPYEQITYEFECSGEYPIRRSRSLVFSSVLPRWIYNTLRLRLPAERKAALITRDELLALMTPELRRSCADEQTFRAAIAEIARVCQTRNLPSLSAIVATADSDGELREYCAEDRPESGSDEERQAAWEQELARVLKCGYREIN